MTKPVDLNEEGYADLLGDIDREVRNDFWRNKFHTTPKAISFETGHYMADDLARHAVARAVLPEGYVAVPIADIERIADDVSLCTSGDWRRIENAAREIRSLLPTEAAND